MWTRKGIMQSMNALEKLTGFICIHIRKLPKKAKIKELNEAWEQDRVWFIGLSDSILQWV